MTLFLSFLFTNTNIKSELLEFDFGYNNPTGLYTKYADPGISFRLAYSKSFNDKGLFKWQAGIQYISFKSDYWSDSVQGISGDGLFNVDINNYEQGFVVNGGFRLSANNGISKNGNFRPYIGTLFGFAFLSERTFYDWGNSCSIIDIALGIVFGTDLDYCNNNNNTTDTDHRSSSPVFTLDLGTNIFFTNNHKFGMDIGIRYNMLTRLKRPIELTELYDKDQTIVNRISRYIEADYYTWYIGVSIKLDEERKQKRKKRRSKRGKGKLI